jgi:hypothetical protein
VAWVGAFHAVINGTSVRVLVLVHLGPAEVLGLAFMVLVVTAIVRTIKR